MSGRKYTFIQFSRIFKGTVGKPLKKAWQRPIRRLYPEKLCPIKNELDINVYKFENWLDSIVVSLQK